MKRGQTLCIVEAMKLMNEIMAELDGEIVEVCVQNGARWWTSAVPSSASKGSKEDRDESR